MRAFLSFTGVASVVSFSSSLVSASFSVSAPVALTVDSATRSTVSLAASCCTFSANFFAFAFAIAAATLAFLSFTGAASVVVAKVALSGA